MKAYYAVFSITDEAVEVEFPDLQGCLTFGDTVDDAYDMAMDALAGWLEASEPQFIKEPSTFEDIHKKFRTDNKKFIMKIPVDNTLRQAYEKKQKINLSMPVSIVKKIDAAAAKAGKNRSHFLMDAAIRMIDK